MVGGRAGLLDFDPSARLSETGRGSDCPPSPVLDRPGVPNFTSFEDYQLPDPAKGVTMEQDLCRCAYLIWKMKDRLLQVGTGCPRCVPGSNVNCFTTRTASAINGE